MMGFDHSLPVERYQNPKSGCTVRIAMYYTQYIQYFDDNYTAVYLITK